MQEHNGRLHGEAFLEFCSEAVAEVVRTVFQLVVAHSGGGLVEEEPRGGSVGLRRLHLEREEEVVGRQELALGVSGYLGPPPSWQVVVGIIGMKEPQWQHASR